MSKPPPGRLDLTAAYEALPLFPLPHTVLFPGATLPLHVFEPRYRAMVRDALAGHPAICVVQIVDENDVDEHGHPRIASVGGVGIVVDHGELPGGRFNILLLGHARVKLEELPFTGPYRRARATPMLDRPETVPETELAALISVATRFVAAVRRREPSFEFRFPRHAKPGAVADVCAHHLLLDAHRRQELLETTSAAQRVQQVAEAIAAQQHALAPNDETVN